jgi:hypothetical protein
MCSDGVLYNTVPYVVLGLLYGGRSCVRIKYSTLCTYFRTIYGTAVTRLLYFGYFYPLSNHPQERHSNNPITLKSNSNHSKHSNRE